VGGYAPRAQEDSVRARRDRALLGGPTTSPLHLTMGTHFGQRPAVRHWRRWTVGIIIGEVCWFGLLYPLVPRTTLAAAVEAALAFPIAASVYFVGRAVYWLSDSQLPPIIRRTCAVLLALSATCLTVGIIMMVKHFLGGQFGYGLFRRA
jgi:hypothetical protein